MPGLDDFYRFIEKQEKNSSASVATVDPPAAENGAAARKVRYVLRGGVTVPEEAAVSGGLPPVKATDVLPPAEASAATPVDEWETSLREAVGADLPGRNAPDWHRLPRHILLLATLSEEPEEEVAAKYYTRGFKETRRELIERLLDPTLTLEETARVLGVCPATVRRYTNRGVLPHFRTVGQQRRFRLSDVLGFLERQQAEGGRRAIAAVAVTAEAA